MLFNIFITGTVLADDNKLPSNLILVFYTYLYWIKIFTYLNNQTLNIIKIIDLKMKLKFNKKTRDQN
jgi:hypothetical protein